jgi:signal recognition particle subunit SRP72
LELKTNMVAAHVAAELSSQVPSLMTSMQVTSKQSFELGFNKACALIQSGQLSAAESELRMALKLGREALLDEDLREEDVAEELAPLTVQLGYVLGQLGRHDESAEAYEEVLSNESLTEEVVRAIAHNNTIAASGKVDGSQQQRKYVAAAARRVEGLLDKDKVCHCQPLFPYSTSSHFFFVCIHSLLL